MAKGKTTAHYVSAIIGITLVLFMLGILGLIVINGRGMSRMFREDIEVSVDFHDNVRDESVQEMKAILDKQPFVRQTKVITKEEALRIQSELDGEDILATAGFNPLFSSIVMKLHSEYVNTDSLEKIKQFVLQSNVVREVTYPTVVVEKISSNIRKAGLIMGIVSFVLFVIVLILIDNTVRLAMFSNRFLIKTMQMVGAKRWFISKPFDKQAIINGLISGVLAVVLLWLVTLVAESWLPELEQLREPVWFGMLATIIVVMGILVSLVSTHRSVVKYLKMQVEDLY